MKRTLDLVLAVSGLVLLSPVLAAIALAVKLSSPGPILFRQERVGRNFEHFEILKFRSMVVGDDATPQITVGDDPRITRLGRFLRRTKLDELPQLVNVVRGDMSLVGPRPEVPRYVDVFHEDYREILTVRPGVTDLASLEYRNEAEILGRSDNAEEEYIRRILPSKIAMAKKYVARHTLLLDLRVILRTVRKLALH